MTPRPLLFVGLLFSVGAAAFATDPAFQPSSKDLVHIGREVPGLAVLAFVVIAFLRALRKRDEHVESVVREARQSQRETLQQLAEVAGQHHSDRLAVVAALTETRVVMREAAQTNQRASEAIQEFVQTLLALPCR